MTTKECGFGYYQMDGSQILRFTITNGDPTLDDLEEYFQLSLEVWGSYSEPFVFAFDASNSKWLSGQARIKVGKDGKILQDKYKHLLKKVFIAIPNPIVKMMLKGVNLLINQEVQQVTVGSMDEALRKAEAEIASWQG